MTFFSPSLAFRQPDWLRDGQRGPDVSEKMYWIPVVTMWQVGADVGAASLVPEGFGHLYGPSEYLNAWVGLVRPGDWGTDDSERLVDYLDQVNASE